MIKIATNDQIRKIGGYDDMIELSRIFQHDIVDDFGRLRWSQNRLIRWITGGLGTHDPMVDLNHLAAAACQSFSLEEYMKFYMGPGYSLDGFLEIFATREVTDYDVEYFETPPTVFEFWESPIEYMLKKYANSTVRL